MLVVMLVPARAAAGLPGRRRGRTGRLLRVAAAAAIPLLALASERRAATGRFAVTTEHGGLGLLGTVAPGSAAAGWVDPTLYAASVEPQLLRQPVALRRAAWRLALDEARRRWRFHAFRSAVAALRLSVESDAQNLFWGLDAPGALSTERAASGAAWARTVRPLLRVELALVASLFIAALALGIRKRDPAILVLCSAVVLKILVQVLFSPLGRLMVPAIALELVVVPLALADLAPPAGRRERLSFVIVAAAAAAALLAALPPLQSLAIRKDEAPPVVRRFPLLIAGGGGWAECVVETGRLTAISGDRAWIGAADEAGTSAQAARASCRLPELRPGAALGLDLECPSVVGAGPGLPTERVEADGRERFRRDLDGKPPAAWFRVPLSDGAEALPREVSIEARGAAVGFGFVRRAPGTPPLPRDLVLP
jgi:hypothetical protein